MRKTAPTLIAILLLAFAARSGAWAQTVSVVPAVPPAFGQEGMPPPEPLESLVSGCLDSFFGAGLIATDSRCVAVERSEWDSPGFGLVEAREGLVNYIIAVYVDWKPSGFQPGTWLIKEASYRLARVSDGKSLTAGILRGPVDSFQNAVDSSRLAQTLGSAIGSACVAALGSRSLGGN